MINFNVRNVFQLILLSVFSMTSLIDPNMSYGQTVQPLLLQPTHAYQPALIKGMTVSKEDLFEFDFLMSRGDGAQLSQDESMKMVKYFLASLAIPEENMWVNLSPHEPDRIIPNDFGQTQMGRDLLAQDYILKQFSASLMHPEGDVGREFWEKIYSSIYRHPELDVSLPAGRQGSSLSDSGFRIESGMTDLFHKIWIVPQKGYFHEQGNTVFITDTHLKVMLESDYIAEVASRRLLVASEKSNNQQQATSNESTKELMKEILLPVIEHEVNHGKHFANLRQIYNAQLLAVWFKKRMKEHILGQIYDSQSDISALKLASDESQPLNTVDQIYQEYLDLFQTGVYDMIREEYDPQTQSIVNRRYFSGGSVQINSKNVEKRTDQASLTQAMNAVSDTVMVDLAAISQYQIDTEYIRYLKEKIKEKTGDDVSHSRIKALEQEYKKHYGIQISMIDVFKILKDRVNQKNQQKLKKKAQIEEALEQKKKLDSEKTSKGRDISTEKGLEKYRKWLIRRLRVPVKNAPQIYNGMSVSTLEEWEYKMYGFNSKSMYLRGGVFSATGYKKKVRREIEFSTEEGKEEYREYLNEILKKKNKIYFSDKFMIPTISDLEKRVEETFGKHPKQFYLNYKTYPISNIETGGQTTVIEQSDDKEPRPKAGSRKDITKSPKYIQFKKDIEDKIKQLGVYDEYVKVESLMKRHRSDSENWKFYSFFSEDEITSVRKSIFNGDPLQQNVQASAISIGQKYPDDEFLFYYFYLIFLQKKDKGYIFSRVSDKRNSRKYSYNSKNPVEQVRNLMNLDPEKNVLSKKNKIKKTVLEKRDLKAGDIIFIPSKGNVYEVRSVRLMTNNIHIARLLHDENDSKYTAVKFNLQEKVYRWPSNEAYTKVRQMIAKNKDKLFYYVIQMLAAEHTNHSVYFDKIHRYYIQFLETLPSNFLDGLGVDFENFSKSVLKNMFFTMIAKMNQKQLPDNFQNHILSFFVYFFNQTGIDVFHVAGYRLLKEGVVKRFGGTQQVQLSSSFMGILTIAEMHWRGLSLFLKTNELSNSFLKKTKDVYTVEKNSKKLRKNLNNFKLNIENMSLQKRKILIKTFLDLPEIKSQIRESLRQLPDVDVVVPVPGTFSSLLAKKIAELLDKPFEEVLAKRSNQKMQQKFISPKGGHLKRLFNAARAIYVKNDFKNSLDPEKTYLLIDDFFTTGASLNMGELQMNLAGAENVVSFVLVGSKLTDNAELTSHQRVENLFRSVREKFLEYKDSILTNVVMHLQQHELTMDGLKQKLLEYLQDDEKITEFEKKVKNISVPGDVTILFVELVAFVEEQENDSHSNSDRASIVEDSDYRMYLRGLLNIVGPVTQYFLDMPIEDIENWVMEVHGNKHPEKYYRKEPYPRLTLAQIQLREIDTDKGLGNYKNLLRSYVGIEGGKNFWGSHMDNVDRLEATFFKEYGFNPRDKYLRGVRLEKAYPKKWRRTLKKNMPAKRAADEREKDEAEKRKAELKQNYEKLINDLIQEFDLKEDIEKTKQILGEYQNKYKFYTFFKKDEVNLVLEQIFKDNPLEKKLKSLKSVYQQYPLDEYFEYYYYLFYTLVKTDEFDSISQRVSTLENSYVRQRELKHQRKKLKEADKAQLDQEVGGIDLNVSQAEIQIIESDNGFVFPDVDLGSLGEIQLSPRIIDIVPTTPQDLRLKLGLSNEIQIPENPTLQQG